MKIGINLTDDIKVKLGEIREILIRDLDEQGIKYSVPFDQTNKQGIKETIITMREPDIEISIENDIVTYIKMSNNTYSNLDNIEVIGNNALEHIQKIKKQVIDKFGINESDIRIEKIDTKTMSITMLVMSNKDKARLQIVRDTYGEVYINTIIAI